MALQLSVAVRNARLDALVAACGASPILKIYTGSLPVDTSATDSETVLSTLNLPASWMNPASSGSITKSGTWQDIAADASGQAAHFRIYANNGITCHIQGTVTATGGGGDMTVDNTNIAAGQQITTISFTLTDANA